MLHMVRNADRSRILQNHFSVLTWSSCAKAPVSQLVEETASKSVQCGFESHRGHRIDEQPWLDISSRGFFFENPSGACAVTWWLSALSSTRRCRLLWSIWRVSRRRCAWRSGWFRRSAYTMKPHFRLSNLSFFSPTIGVWFISVLDGLFAFIAKTSAFGDGLND